MVKALLFLLHWRRKKTIIVIAKTMKEIVCADPTEIRAEEVLEEAEEGLEEAEEVLEEAEVFDEVEEGSEEAEEGSEGSGQIDLVGGVYIRSSSKVIDLLNVNISRGTFVEKVKLHSVP